MYLCFDEFMERSMNNSSQEQFLGDHSVRITKCYSCIYVSKAPTYPKAHRAQPHTQRFVSIEVRF